LVWLNKYNLCLFALKTYDYIPADVGLKISTEIEEFYKQHSLYPNDFNSI